jgi:hypothetical protein
MGSVYGCMPQIMKSEATRLVCCATAGGWHRRCFRKATGRGGGSGYIGQQQTIAPDVKLAQLQPVVQQERCYVFRYLSRRTAFYPTVIRRDLENVFL